MRGGKERRSRVHALVQSRLIYVIFFAHLLGEKMIAAMKKWAKEKDEHHQFPCAARKEGISQGLLKVSLAPSKKGKKRKRKKLQKRAIEISSQKKKRRRVLRALWKKEEGRRVLSARTRGVRGGTGTGKKERQGVSCRCSSGKGHLRHASLAGSEGGTVSSAAIGGKQIT